MIEIVPQLQTIPSPCEGIKGMKCEVIPLWMVSGALLATTESYSNNNPRVWGFLFLYCFVATLCNDERMSITFVNIRYCQLHKNVWFSTNSVRFKVRRNKAHWKNSRWIKRMLVRWNALLVSHICDNRNPEFVVRALNCSICFAYFILYIWWIVEVPYWWKRGCCTAILGIFPREVKDIILHEVRLNPREVRTSENSETWKNSNFLFGWRGPLVVIFDRVGGGGRRRVVGGRGSRWVAVRGQIRWVGGS